MSGFFTKIAKIRVEGPINLQMYATPKIASMMLLELSIN